MNITTSERCPLPSAVPSLSWSKTLWALSATGCQVHRFLISQLATCFILITDSVFLRPAAPVLCFWMHYFSSCIVFLKHFWGTRLTLLIKLGNTSPSLGQRRHCLNLIFQMDKGLSTTTAPADWIFPGAVPVPAQRLGYGRQPGPYATWNLCCCRPLCRRNPRWITRSLFPLLELIDKVTWKS